MSGPVIEVQELKKSYGDVKAVNGVSFKIEEGEIFSLLGPNGAGKTTTVEIIEGIRKADSGNVSVLGHNPWTDAKKLHYEVGVIPQDFTFFDKATPEEAIKYYASLFNVSVDVDSLLEKVKLSDSKKIVFDNLSGGQRQKMGLTLALVNDPKILFLDEPTTGLDPYARRAIWDVIKTFKLQKKTIFLTTHYLEEAEMLADKVAIMDHGKIIAMGTPEEIIKEHGRPHRLIVKGDGKIMEFLQQQIGLTVSKTEEGIEIVINRKEEILKALSAIEYSSLPYSELLIKRDTLEDIFVRLVGKIEEV
jgi:ABC-2 type transport system ATP-binding protein